MALLDTCTLLWLAADQASLSGPAVAAIRSAKGNLAVCAISAFEIAVKHARKKLVLPLPPDQWYAKALAAHGIREIPVDGRCALLAAVLPPIHRDPCDRFLIATATLHGLPIVTADANIARYPGVRVIW
jgi:PIN domain nuclease of toxin-antitoxin system